MRSLAKWVTVVQILAAFGLGLSYFLPFYRSAAGDVRTAEAWGLFFWPIAVLVLLHFVSNRWLKVVVCLLAAVGGVGPLVLLAFLANFKSTPLVGFTVARAALVILLVGWLIRGGMALRSGAAGKAKTNLPT